MQRTNVGPFAVTIALKADSRSRWLCVSLRHGAHSLLRNMLLYSKDPGVSRHLTIVCLKQTQSPLISACSSSKRTRVPNYHLVRSLTSCQSSHYHKNLLCCYCFPRRFGGFGNHTQKVLPPWRGFWLPRVPCQLVVILDNKRVMTNTVPNRMRENERVSRPNTEAETARLKEILRVKTEWLM